MEAAYIKHFHSPQLAARPHLERREGFGREMALGTPAEPSVKAARIAIAPP